MYGNLRACPVATRPHLHATRGAVVVATDHRQQTYPPVPESEPLAPHSWLSHTSSTSGLGNLLWCKSKALMQMVFAMAYFKLGQVRDRLGTAGAGFDVLCAGVGCVLGDWPDRVWGHFLESQAATGAGTGAVGGSRRAGVGAGILTQDGEQGVCRRCRTVAPGRCDLPPACVTACSGGDTALVVPGALKLQRDLLPRLSPSLHTRPNVFSIRYTW